MHCVLKPPRRWKGWWKAALNRETQRVLSQGLASLADPWGRPPGPAGIVKTEAGIVKTEVLVKSEVPASVRVLDDHPLELLELAPYPFVSRPIAPADYRARIRISR